MKGEEVIQLYVGFENSKIDRPKKLLKGFIKVELKPQESREVTLEVKKNKLSYYNPEKKQWEIEKIKYKILVGPSSNVNTLLTSEIVLD
jgi:beta-glucosidase